MTESYGDVYAKDPTYSFTKFLQPLTRVLDSMSNTNPQGATNSESTSKGKSANRPNATVKIQKSFNEMDTKEMESWFAMNRR